MPHTWYEKNKEKVLLKRKARYHSDPEWRKIHLEKTSQWRKANPEKMRLSRLKWEKNTPEWIMYHNAKRRSKEEGLPFEISFKDIVIPIYCPVLGILLDNTTRETGPSLDKIIPSLGYIPTNIRVISMRANRLKSDGTAEEHLKIANYITKS